MKGILFTPDNIRAIEENRKTVTRRLAGLKEINKAPDDWCEPLIDTSEHSWLFIPKEHAGGIRVKPRYRVGDIVYIKEAWASDCICENPKCNGVIYKLGYAGKILPDKWRSPLFMPAWAARYFLKILDVRPERLRSIIPEDCIAEGIYYDKGAWYGGTPYGMKIGFTISSAAYEYLWDSINPKYPFSSNPWCFRYEFIKVAKP